MNRPCIRRAAILAAAACVGACAGSPAVGPTASPGTGQGASMLTRSDLEIVDCLLPGQVRQLGNSTYLTQRRPVHATVSECRIRGGEYVAYDRADLKSSLRVWMAAAEAGDAEAQTNVGEIYERGLGTEPNYEAAALWYRRAADQGNSSALFHLGTLYEQGLGVEQDRLKALNLYRQAWGVPEDDVIFTSAAQREQDKLREELESALAEKQQQVGLLQKQLAELQRQLEKAPQDTQAQREIQALQQWIARLEAERRENGGRLAALPARTREPAAQTQAAPLDSKAEARRLLGLDFGRYYALVIGNQHYQVLEDLQTPASDAARAAQLLREKYGFNVQTIEDADDVTMLRALNDLNRVLQPNDNVLIYYAGHGTRLGTGRTETGYWLPVNAEAPPDDTFWVPNEQISAHLARLPAKRVLVVADSCYAGLLSSDPGVTMFGTEGAFSLERIKYRLPKRSRLLLASGGDQPVLDSGGGGHSVFARAFLDVLADNDGVLTAAALYSQVQRRVESGAAREKFQQTPQFKAMKTAGHELGEFYFVPRGRGS